MKTTQEIFKEVLIELGFADYKPSQMTNSDYWLCTNTAMERYASQSIEATLRQVDNILAAAVNCDFDTDCPKSQKATYEFLKEMKDQINPLSPTYDKRN